MGEVVKTSEAGYLYDQKSGAIINDNQNEWLKFQAERNKALQILKMQKQIDDLERRFAELEEKYRNV